MLGDGGLSKRDLTDDLSANTSLVALEKPEDLDPRRVGEGLREARQFGVRLAALDRPKIRFRVGGRTAFTGHPGLSNHRIITIGGDEPFVKCRAYFFRSQSSVSRWRISASRSRISQKRALRFSTKAVPPSLPSG